MEQKKVKFAKEKSMRETMEWKPLTSQYDPALADLIRASLKENHLDIPGTVYFDEGLDHLSRYYSHDGRAYYVLLQMGHLSAALASRNLTAAAVSCKALPCGCCQRAGVRLRYDRIH